MTSQPADPRIVTIGKDALATLPTAEYKGEVIVVDNLSKLDAAIQILRQSKIIGFDTETRPSFRKGQSYKVALIQLATYEKCFLFRTNIIGFPEPLINILEDPTLLKVGLSIHDDFHNLKKVTEINPEGFIDLQTYVKDYKIVDNSLSKIYGILFGERISKGQRLSNWEASELTESQQGYAALDAYACTRIYSYLKEGKFEPKSSPYFILPPPPKDTELKEDSTEK